MGNQKWTTQGNWQHRPHKMKKNKSKTQHNMCWTPLHANKHKSKIRRGVLDTILCDKVSQGLATGRWFSPGTHVSSTDKTDLHDITKILLKVALNTITPTHHSPS
jgi:hypothetical protein